MIGQANAIVRTAPFRSAEHVHDQPDDAPVKA